MSGAKRKITHIFACTVVYKHIRVPNYFECRTTAISFKVRQQEQVFCYLSLFFEIRIIKSGKSDASLLRVDGGDLHFFTIIFSYFTFLSVLRKRRSDRGRTIFSFILYFIFSPLIIKVLKSVQESM